MKKAIAVLLSVSMIIGVICAAGSFSVSAEEENEAVFSVVGSSTAIFGKQWDVEDTSTEMTYDETDGLYKYTLRDVQPEENIIINVVMNHSIESYNSYPLFNSTEFTVVSKCDILVTYDAEKTLVKVYGDGIKRTEIDSVCVMGNGSYEYLNGEDWNPCAESNMMTEIEEDVWELSLKNVFAYDSFQFKFVGNPGANTSDPLEYNWGAPTETKCMSGEEYTGAFQGNVCTFAVEQIGSTVTFRLDLREFDDTTKEGAKFSVTVTQPVPPSVDVFSVVGSSTAIFGTAYNLNDESTVMTYDPDDGLYKYTFTDVQPEKNVTFAVVMNHKWYDVYPVFNEETINIISPGDILVTYDAKATKIELSGDGIQTTIDVENAIAVGNGSENFMNNEYWNPTAEINSMKEVSDGVWEYTCADVPAGEDYQIKACFNSIGNENPYEYNFGAVDDNKVELGAELTASFNGRPCHFDVAEDGSTVTYRLDISNFNFYTKQGAKFSITVTPPEDVYTVQVVNTGFYPYPEEVPMTYDGEGLYVLAAENVEPQNMYIYVWKNHTEKYGDPDAGNGYPYEINVEETCDVLITFDPETGIINAVGDGVMPPLDLYIDSVIVAGNGEGNYLNGANWDPADTSNSMTEVDDGVWELTMENIDAYDNYNFKFAVDSVDEYGNPTTEPWRYSFGAKFEQLYPTGADLDAVYGGKNIIFEAEEDSSTVIIRLDLRDFDFQTKKGAKFSVTIPAPEGNRYEDAFVNWTTSKFGEGCLDNGYDYDELYTHFDGDEPDWVLLKARYYIMEPEPVLWLKIGGVGGRTICSGSIQSPFAFGYGVYNVKENKFYGLECFADDPDDLFLVKPECSLDYSEYDGLIEALADSNIGYLTGDANGDNKVDILDAAFIQKYASGKADMDYDDKYIADVNGDNVVDILDATAIQKYAAA